MNDIDYISTTRGGLSKIRSKAEAIDYGNHQLGSRSKSTRAPRPKLSIYENQILIS